MRGCPTSLQSPRPRRKGLVDVAHRRPQLSHQPVATPVLLEAALAELRMAVREFEQALWDGNQVQITEARQQLSSAIRTARRVGAHAARLAPNLAELIAAHPSRPPAEARLA